MDEVKVCPHCNRCTDPDRDRCPYCGRPFARSNHGTTIQTDAVQDSLNDSAQMRDNGGSILLSTMPERASFFYKYLMALFPIVLVILSFYARMLLEILFNVGSSSVSSAVSTILPHNLPNNVPGIMSGYTNSALSMNQYAGPVNYASAIIILMIAPVGIFIVFAATGWTMRLTELWTSTSLTLGMSGLAGVIMAGLSGVPPALSADYLLLLLKWIEFLVQPFCIVAAVIVIITTEKFRQSITYTITKEGVLIRGGFLFIQEHMLPHNQIGRIVIEQDFLGKRYNYGTLIPLSMTRWGEETSFRAIGASGQKDNFGVGIGFAKGRQEGSRYPLDCLYGIPDPRTAQNILTEFVCKHDKREDEQVSYLKKIYETNVAKTRANGPGIPPQGSDIITGRLIPEDTRSRPHEDLATDGENPEYHATKIVRIGKTDVTDTTISSVSGTIREIPPTIKNGVSSLQEISPDDPVIDTIKKLAELRNSGIISEQEFITKKTELLKRL